MNKVWQSARRAGNQASPMLQKTKRAFKHQLNSAGETVSRSFSLKRKAAIKTVKLQQTGFLPTGHLHSRLAVVNVNNAVLSKPRQNLPGDFYAKNGKYYIKDGNYMFEVYSDSGWMPDTIRVRDPNDPHAQGPLIRFKDGQWQKNEAGLVGGGQCLGKSCDTDVNLELPAVQDSVRIAAPGLEPADDTLSAYKMPDSDRETFQQLADDPRGLDPNYGAKNDIQSRVRNSFLSKRSQLIRDAKAVFDKDVIVPSRPNMPDITEIESPQDFIAAIYREAGGMVIGEFHASIASKQFLIDHMSNLKKQQVKTLYMEHLQSDIHQPDLDQFFQTGNMPNNLKKFLDTQDVGHNPLEGADPTYNFLNIVNQARAHDIRIVAIDTTTSYNGLNNAGISDDDKTLRQQLFSFVAPKIIQQDQLAAPGKWVALVGETHANTYTTTTRVKRGLPNVPGLAELSGGVGVRVRDLPPGTTFKVSQGQEEYIPEDISHVILKPDFEIASGATRGRITTRGPLSRILKQPGDFFVDVSSSSLISVSADGTFKTTPILRADGKVYIESRPEWGALNTQRFDNLDALLNALKTQKGMRNASPQLRNLLTRGEYVLERSSGDINIIVYKSPADGRLKTVDILHDQNSVYVISNSPNWVKVSGVRYDTLGKLVKAIQQEVHLTPTSLSTAMAKPR